MGERSTNDVDTTQAASGYALDKVYFPRLALEYVEPHPGLPATPTNETWSVGWDWRVNVAGERAFDVTLTMKLQPTQARPETLYAVVVGQFHLVGPTPPPLAFPRFVLLGAPTLLFPYIREAVSNLTMRGPLGPLLLDPINLTSAMAAMKMGATTAARQIAADLGLASAFGDVEVLLGQKPLPITP
jgi:preprotein translocase subunit SecB